MELWTGPINDFVRNAQAGSLASAMIARYYTYHGCQPNAPEVRSWENSLTALGETTRELQNRDIGVVIEYHLPFTGERIDAVFLGKSQVGMPQALVVELKQWSKVEVEDEFALNVLVDGHERSHPSQQALDYAGCLRDIHSAFVTGRLAGRSCSYCHTLLPHKANALLSDQFTHLLAGRPLVTKAAQRPLQH